MTTRTYASCLSRALALCGIPDANAVEVARVKEYINLAAERAYGESDYWPRWLRTEERICSEDGLLPYSETGKEDIAVCRRIHATEPFAECSSGDYTNYYARADGIQIAGYTPCLYGGYADQIIVGSVSPNINGRYAYSGQSSAGVDGTTAPTYQHPDFTGLKITPVLSYTLGGSFVGYKWALGDLSSGSYWLSTPADLLAVSPDIASGTYEEQGGASEAEIEVTKATTYSVWVTYKAAFGVTYGTGEDETSVVPAEWFSFMAYAAYAAWLGAEGQQEKSALEDAKAVATYLVPQLEDLDSQSGTHAYTRQINHGNAQAR